MCFPYTFKALFVMVPIFEDFAPSFLSPLASGSSLPFSEAPFGTPSGHFWASYGADLAGGIRPGGLREPSLRRFEPFEVASGSILQHRKMIGLLF